MSRKASSDSDNSLGDIIGVVLLAAAVLSSRALRVVALLTYLVHGVPHLAYHARHVPAALPVWGQALTWLPLALGVLLAIGVLLEVSRGASRQASPRRRSADAGRPRVEGIEGWPRNPLLFAAFTVARRRLGVVPDAWRVTARVPRVGLARAAGDAAHQRTRLVPTRIGVLACLRAGMLVECAFCVDILSAVAVQQGVRDEQITQLGRWREASVYDADERLALELAEAMTDTPAHVPDELAASLLDRFGAEGLIELAATIGHENARARANRAIGVGPQGFAAAAACPLPEPVRR